MPSFVKYLLGRVGQTVVVMAIVATMVFFLFHMIPGDGARANLGISATDEQIAIWREQRGLNDPIIIQFLRWFGNVLQGDFGLTDGYGQQPVLSVLGPSILRTLELAVLSTIVAVAVSIILAAVAVGRVHSKIDYSIRTGAILLFAMPGFWLGILLLLVFSRYLGWFPAGGYVSPATSLKDHIVSLVLPTVTVAGTLTGVFVRFLRTSLVNSMQQDYILLARAKGLSPRKALYSHAMRNSLISFVTVVGMQFGLLLGGLVIAETVFNWPGLGLLLVQGVANRAYTIVQGAVLIMALAFVVVNTLVDIAYRLIDPRITYA